MDQWQPHENSWTACQSSQVVNWVKTKPGLAGNQIPFGGTRFGFTTAVGVYNRGTVFPRIVSALEYFPPLNSFRGQNLLKINSFRP